MIGHHRRSSGTEYNCEVILGEFGCEVVVDSLESLAVRSSWESSTCEVIMGELGSEFVVGRVW